MSKRNSLTFEQFANEYLVRHTTGKAETTLKVEASVINRLTEEFGAKRLGAITAADVNSFRHKRFQETSGRTVNLNISILSAMLKVARTLGYIERLPTEQVKPIRYQAKRKPLLSAADIEAVCATAQMHVENGIELADFVKFLALTGARASEALCSTWDNFRKADRVFTFPLTKNRGVRDVDLGNTAMEHLKDMESRRDKFQPKLFKSNYHSLLHTLEIAAKKSGKTHVNGFHNFRHYFASRCVMSGIDMMTTSKWLGHQDGGVLVAKIYGHLDNRHTQAQAAKLRL